MKTKDLICYIGAPVKTTGEVAGGAAIIGGVIWLLMLFFTSNWFNWLLQAHPVFWAWAAYIGLGLYFALGGGVVALGMFSLFYLRTSINFVHCQEYWHSNEVSDNSNNN